MPLRGALLSLPQKFSKGRLYRDPQPTWVVTMPREWKADVVRMSFTTPLVRFPVRWSCFCVMDTRSPGLMSLRC